MLVLWLAACGCASVTRVTAPTGPPEILNRWWNETLPPMDLPRYEQELLHQANRANLVPVHEWPADLPAEEVAGGGSQISAHPERADDHAGPEGRCGVRVRTARGQ